MMKRVLEAKKRLSTAHMDSNIFTRMMLASTSISLLQSVIVEAKL